jgi:hypothetical protein
MKPNCLEFIYWPRVTRFSDNCYAEDGLEYLSYPVESRVS